MTTESTSRKLALAALLTVCSACGPQTIARPEPQTAVRVGEAQVTSAKVSTPAALTEVPTESKDNAANLDRPTTCAGGPQAKPCLPPAEVAKRLCSTESTDLAIEMFSKSTPWTRAYLKYALHAWNVAGARAHRTLLAEEEEVILLAKHDPSSGSGLTIVGSQPTYDVLRWDGACVSVDGSELRSRKPVAPRAANLVWERLGESTRSSLLAVPTVRSARDARDKACSSTGAPTKREAHVARCEGAERSFHRAVIEAVRQGQMRAATAARP